MIKAEVNVIGTISRSAAVRTDKSGSAYLAFPLVVNLVNQSDQTTMPVTVYVTVPNGQQSDLALYTEGTRVAVNGTMDIHKKDDSLTFFLTAKYIVTEGVAAIDSISGTMSFRGHLRNDNVYEEKSSKSGKQYLRFSAYSAEKDGDNFVSTWVNFVRFPDKDADISTIKEDWMTAKAHVSIRGTLGLDAYKGKININSRVLEMSQYIPQSMPQNS